MVTVLLVIQIVLAVFLIAMVLFQKSEGGALGMGGGAGNFMTSRGTANLLTRTTAVLATLFFLSTLGLAVMFKGGSVKSSLLDEVETTAPVKTQAPALPDPAPSSLPDPAPTSAAPVKEAAPSKEADVKQPTSASKKAKK